MRIGAIVCLILTMSVGAWAQTEEPTDISGAWKITIDTPQGAVTADLVIKLEENKITGTLTSEQGTLDIAGTITDEGMTFGGEVNGFTITFSGKPDPKSMSGSVDFGGNGSGGWTAERAGHFVHRQS
jgi:quinohemoprotein ethanol dehydrogenase